MADRANSRQGEARHISDMAPEVENAGQVDSRAQAQTVAGEAMQNSASVLGLDEDSEKLSISLSPASKQDLMDHMVQMETSGTIDTSACAGEPNHDDRAPPR